MKRVALITGTVVALLATLVLAGAAARPTADERAIIQGCQTITMNDSTPPFPTSVTWVPTENAHHYGSYRISGDCSQQLNADLLGIGPDSSPGRCASILLHVQQNDGTWRNTTTAHDCVGGANVRVAGFLPVNHRFYLHCADRDRDPQEDQPCRIRFTF